MLLELLGGNGCLHDLSRIIDLAVLDNFEALINHTLESILASEVTSERAASKETGQEILKHVNFGEVKSLIGELAVLDHTLGGLTTVLLELSLSEANVSEIGSVHDRFDGHIVEFLSAESLIVIVNDQLC